MAALKKAQTVAQQEAEALIRLIDGTPATTQVGQHLNVYV